MNKLREIMTNSNSNTDKDGPMMTMDIMEEILENSLPMPCEY